MRQHPQIGHDMLYGIPFLRPALELVLYHHERFDGSGYPNRLAADAIPLSARIFAVADTYDAITSNRPYRKGRSRDEAVEEIRRQAGKQFDPIIVRMFMRAINRQ
jgi:HD-GYP domain-containing protein (c-di-GMP phosphodiesterase class II)